MLNTSIFIQNGEFVIKTSEKDFGTSWKMNPRIVKGRENVTKHFFNTLGYSWH